MYLSALKALGYQDAVVLKGGLKAWMAAGLPAQGHEFTGI
ncbi:rhodanese-related sulfurtransferase [Arthrobacter sp. UYEF36]